MKKVTSSQFLLLQLLALWFTSLAFGANTTQPEEVQALKDMGKILGKKEWDTDIDPCSSQHPWFTPKVDTVENNVTCNCSIPGDNFCHVVSILLKSQNLPGKLPPELIRLPYLEEIDLTRNYLNGTIPTEWGSSNLRKISLLGNRLTGPIPKEIGNITTLESLVLEFNQFSENLPPELGNLSSIQRLHLTSNNFTGELPETLAKLTTLTELRLSDNNFSGKIPDFIHRWTNLVLLSIQGSGLSGPIPSGISFLQNLTDLRISDLNGSDSTFPPINNMTKLQTLDLSFNKLSGQILETYKNLSSLTYIYFTENLFTGPVPNWIEDAVLNSLHINCGGARETSSEGIIYDGDSDSLGPSTSKEVGENWAISNTGHFLNSNASETYIQQNTTRLSMPDNALYKTARVSPISLTYYGFCLENGDYTVTLHFAEIAFTDDDTYKSLGRRIFDIYIQRKLVWKDFNIAYEAGGVGKEIKIPFPAYVNNNSLEIRFYWAGKGTDGIPYKSIYGPLISAISVTRDSTGGSMSAGVVVGIVVAAIVLVILIVLCWRIYIRKRNSLAKELKDLNLQTSLFTMHQIKVATNNFDISNKIGEGGFGPVYKGILSNGTIIAVKMLSSRSKQGNRSGESRLKLDWPTRHKICLGIARGLAFLHEESRLKIVHRDIKATNVLLDKDLNPKISDFGLAKLDEEDNTHISTRIAGTYGYMAPEYAMHDKADVYSFGVVALEIVSGKSNTIHRPKQEALHLLDWAHLLKEKGNLMELVDRRLGSNFNENEVMMMIKVALLCTNATSNLRPTMSSVLSILEGRTMIPEFISDPSEIMDEMKLEAMRQYYFQIEENERNETQTESHMQVMKDIGRTLGKKNWDFSVDPCSGQSNWTSFVQVKGFENAVTCICLANASICHVVSIVLKSQNLSGTLPTELVRLPYLQEIDLSRNYLNGTIPSQWGSMNLVNISILGNRLTGSIPKELGNITTLKSLVLEFNQLSGVLPPELGNLPRLERLLLTSNYFTGNLPATFSRLTRLKQLRLGDNQFSGTLPNFMQSWTSLERLVMQGSGFSGPIPSGISFLNNLTDLRISDLKGPDSLFPQLKNLTSLQTLVLRSCNLVGMAPEYLGNVTTLRSLDLSFNKLTGSIPRTLGGLNDINLLYLTGNLFTGPLPNWIDRPDYTDLSYNNLTIENPEQLTCQQGSVNLFASSLKGKNLGMIPCLGNSNCPKTWYSLHINCGGKLISNGNMKYDDDSLEAGPARFRRTGSNWVFSNTGHFFDSSRLDYYTWSNTTKLAMDNGELYMDARVSALSLTYYAFCMGNGSYTVSLHFAEIMFTDDQTYSSLGRRVFDIYIQRKLVVKDFNIAKEAGGVGKAIIKKFNVTVNISTLEIRLQWAGKGTTGIPFGSVHGPLISAISVDPDFTPREENRDGTPVQFIVAIVVTGALVIIIIFGIAWWKGCLGRKGSLERELRGVDLQTGLFSLRQMKAATNNFDIAFKIGEGGFGPVYKGVLSDGKVIAVKQLSSKSKQGNREFINEVGMISALQHPCLVKLYGCCMEGDQLMLIYEYMENNSLARALFAQEKCQLKLDWSTRQRICVGIAKGLAYLHGESRLKIVHRDIKATNVLLDKNLNPKISDFGLAKLDEEGYTHITTRIAGTYGYMAPEYAMHDVYSFGIVALEIISGKSNSMNWTKEGCFSLVDWVHLLKEQGNIIDLVDERLGKDFKKGEVMVMINVALLCTQVSPTNRPTMASVVCMLEGKTEVQEVVSVASHLLDGEKLEMIQQYYNMREKNKTNETQEESISMGETSAFMSDTDLYSINMDSSYQEKSD
ncbi:putative leucine-rich repeat receptor-like serine/threonine-protein kinase [Glycine max]|nr:putative leucine-rich repeat receptor-like serine/threonine-protein kinase [Glycine max]